MAEVEIHAEHEHSNDEFGRGVGVVVGIIGIILAVVTISSHRAHTASVIARTEANDQWSFFQGKKLRQHLADTGASVVSALTTDPTRVQAVVDKMNKDRDRYEHDSDDIQKEAKAKEEESQHEERRALRLDMGEGFLELGLVLSSLYFLSKRRFFPVIGGIAALIGTGLGIAGYIV
jgi:hypothetical protein